MLEASDETRAQIDENDVERVGMVMAALIGSRISWRTQEPSRLLRHWTALDSKIETAPKPAPPMEGRTSAVPGFGAALECTPRT